MAQDDNPRVVHLKCGADESLVVVNELMGALQDLLNTNPFAFYDLVMACREPDRSLSRGIADLLISMKLVEDVDTNLVPRIHDTIRGVVLSGVEGELSQMRLVDPVANE